MDCSPPGSSVHGISQARTLEWVAISSSRGSSRTRDRTCVSPVSPALAGTFVAAAAAVKLLQSCPTLCEPIDSSPPGSPVPGILQARTPEWLPFPSPVHESEKWKWSRSVVSDSSRPHGLPPTRLLRPWDFPGKRTGVGSHCLLGADSLPLSKRQNPLDSS